MTGARAYGAIQTEEVIRHFARIKPYSLERNKWARADDDARIACAKQTHTVEHIYAMQNICTT